MSVKKQQQNKETVKSSAAKQKYLNMGPERSLAKLCVLLGKPTGYTRLLEEWSRNFEWSEAAKKFDREVINKEEKERRRKANEAIDKMNEDQAKVANGLFVRASARLNEMLTAKDKNDKLYGRDAVSLFKEAAALERLARGEATERTETGISDNEQTKRVLKTVWGATGKINEDDEN